ncbi:MAG: hypothetical protein ABIG42_12055, partial [bacterium]
QINQIFKSLIITVLIGISIDLLQESWKCKILLLKLSLLARFVINITIIWILSNDHEPARGILYECKHKQEKKGSDYEKNNK